METLFAIIHEDAGLLVINKPAGLVCHPTKNGELSSLIGRARLHLLSTLNPQTPTAPASPDPGAHGVTRPTQTNTAARQRPPYQTTEHGAHGVTRSTQTNTAARQRPPYQTTDPGAHGVTRSTQTNTAARQRPPYQTTDPGAHGVTRPTQTSTAARQRPPYQTTDPGAHGVTRPTQTSTAARQRPPYQTTDPGAHGVTRPTQTNTAARQRPPYQTTDPGAHGVTRPTQTSTAARQRPPYQTTEHGAHGVTRPTQTNTAARQRPPYQTTDPGAHGVTRPTAAAAPHLINRLDRETSGVVLIAKNSALAGELGKIWEARAVEKEYLAIVHGHVRDDHGLIDAPLGKDESSIIVVKDCVRPDGAPSQTEYWVEKRFNRPPSPILGRAGSPLPAALVANAGAHGVTRPTELSTINSQLSTFSLLRVIPKTGRKHQIRIHLAHLGHPIVGDKLYGGDEDLYLALVQDRLTPEQRARLILPHQALHARALRFAWRGRPVEFACDPEPWFQEFASFV